MKNQEIHEITVTVKRDGDGFYQATAFVEIDGVAARFEHRTEPNVSRLKARAISYALAELAVMFDQGKIKLESEVSP